jgi:pyruvate/2-oxoglutarate dehydrogenase complex dihydrolipoamide dehydrogenase (E3) component
VPVIEADVLVVGGGTSGATAAITLAKEGLRTVLLELNPGLGGTGTLGGVNSYWFGRHVGFCSQVKQLVSNVQEKISNEMTQNIEARKRTDEECTDRAVWKTVEYRGQDVRTLERGGTGGRRGSL